MRKVLSWILALVMVLMLCPTMAYAADGIKLEGTQKDTTVTVKLVVPEYKNVMISESKIEFDKTALELKSVTAGTFAPLDFEAPSISKANNDGYVTVGFTNESLNTATFKGTVATLVFAVKDGAAPGNYNVKLTELTMTASDYTTNIAEADVASLPISYVVKVDAPPKYVEEIKLNASEITLSVNGTSQLTATVTPADADNTAVRWQSKNTKIATVDNTGKVTGVKVGKTEVTATSCDGTKIVATCVVNVVACTHAGTIKPVPAKDATCTETGNKAYYACTKCGAAFLDAEGNQPTTVAAQTIPAKDHKLTETPAVKPDCKHDGKAAYWTCSECHKTFVKNGNKLVEVTDMNQLVIPSTGEHDWKFVAKSEKNGYTLLQFKCSGCDTVEWDAFVGCDVSVTLVKDEKSKGDLKDADVTVTGNDGSIKMSEGDTIDIENVNIADVIGTGADEDAAIAALKEKLENTTFTVKATAKKSGWKFDTVKTEVKFIFTDNGVQAVIEKNGEQTPVEKLSFTITGKKTTGGGNGGSGNGGSTTTDTTKNDGKKVESGKTFDAGIAMYVGLSVLSVTGGALVIGKKKERF